MAFSIDTARLEAIADRHSATLEKAERAIGFALIRDDDIAPNELIPLLKWMSAARFAVLIESEGREPHNSDFVAFTDAVCEAAAA